MKNSNPLIKDTKIKQINFDQQSGKLMLYDSNNNHYECNVYGDHLHQFLPNISGIASSKERKINDPTNPIFQEKKFTSKLYHPQKSIYLFKILFY
jgi:hypothetical protein